MAMRSLSPAQANIDLTLWQVEADYISSSDLYIWLVNSGLPNNVACRLHELISFTKKVGKKFFDIGKILLIRIIDFVKEHPFLLAGLGISAVVGTAITTLITSIPFLGQVLAPVAAALGITITVIGTVAGHTLDKKFSGVGENLTEIVQDFFSLLSDVFNIVFRNVVTA